YHATTDTFSRSRSYLRNTLSQWQRLYKEQGNPMWYYGYNWNLAENLMPYTKVRIYGQDIAYYKSIGIMGHNQESDKAWSILGPHNHLLARLSWDTSLDWQKELNDYCRKAFGEGGPAMAEYFKLVDHQQTHSGVEAGSYAAIPHVLGRDFVAKARALFAKAGTAAKGEMDRKRVLYFSKPLDMLELFLDYTEAGVALDFAKVTASYDAMLKLWDEVNAMNGELFSRYPRKWYHKAFLGNFAKLGLKHSTGEYRIVEPLPDRMKAMLDPYVKGQEMSYQHPDLNDEACFTVATYSKTFEQQGLGGMREGAIWYRHRFTLKEKDRKQPIGLFVGQVEDEVNVFINGKYIGYARGWPSSYVFDLSDGIQTEGENVLALQVVRRGKLNEAGHGGIVRPCFLFTGPKLKQKAPKDSPVGRVLPGGAIDNSSYK
ncbi:MAG: DUF4838 domain-containing protein, partial [Planctomycetota bacterium]